jgi:hypothetical protein
MTVGAAADGPGGSSRSRIDRSMAVTVAARVPPSASRLLGEPPDLDQLQAQPSNPAQDAEQRRLVGQLATQDRTDRIDGELQPLPRRDSSRVAAVTSDPERVSDLCHEQHPRPLG